MFNDTYKKKILYVKVIVNLIEKNKIFLSNWNIITDIKYVSILTVIIFENFY